MTHDKDCMIWEYQPAGEDGWHDCTCHVFNPSTTSAMTHDPLCPYRPAKWYGWMYVDKEIPCQCNFIRIIRGDERMSCIEDVEGAYIVGTDGNILDTSHPEYSHDGTDNWNTAISVAVSYLKGLD